MASISAGLVNATNLTVTGTQSGAVSATNFNTQNVNTGTVNATNQILSNGPMRDGVSDYLPNTRTQVQAFLDNIIATLPTATANVFAAYGNAKDTTIEAVVSGKQSNGSALPADPYYRMASTSKMIGAICAAKLMADGWINMDTPIASFLGNGWYDASGIAHGDMIPDSCGNIPRDASGQYIKPWLSKNRTIIDVVDASGKPLTGVNKLDASGNILDASGNIATIRVRPMSTAWAEWCAAQNPPINSTVNPCPDLTVSHCLNHTAGLTYDYYTIGKYWDLFSYDGDIASYARTKLYGYSDYLTIYATGQVGSSYPDPSQNYNVTNPPARLVDASGNGTYTSDGYLTLMSTQPMSSIPGLFSTYCRGYDLLGLFFDQLIKQTPALSALYSNAIDYAQKTILIPIGITDSWVMGGQSAAPADCNTRMISSTITRPKTTAVLTKAANHGIVDTSNASLVSITGVPVAKYAFTDASGFNYQGYYDSSNNELVVFMDHVPNDTETVGFNNIYFQKTVNTNIKHVGQMGSAWCMSISSFAKLLRLTANKGYDVVSKTRIMPKAAFTYAYQSTTAENSGLTGISDVGHFFSNAPIELSYSYGYPLSWGFGGWKFGELSTIPYQSPSWSLSNGILASPTVNIPPLYPFAPGGHLWAGIYNTGWYMDPESGNFVIFGTQQPGWSGAVGTFFQPNRSYTKAVPPGPNPPYLGAAPVKSANSQPYALSRLVTILDGQPN